MGYIVFLTCMILEFCPVEGWNWDFSFSWVILGFILLVQVAIDVTKVTGKSEEEK